MNFDKVIRPRPYGPFARYRRPRFIAGTADNADEQFNQDMGQMSVSPARATSRVPSSHPHPPPPLL